MAAPAEFNEEAATEGRPYSCAQVVRKFRHVFHSKVPGENFSAGAVAREEDAIWFGVQAIE